MPSFWSKYLRKTEPQVVRTHPLYQVPEGVYYYDYAALQAAKLGIFVSFYTLYPLEGKFVKWSFDKALSSAFTLEGDAKKLYKKISTSQELYEANREKLKRWVKSESDYNDFVDFLLCYLRGQDIAEEELAEAEHLRTEAQRAKALVGAYRLNLHDSPLMAELAATQDVQLLRQVTERLTTLEEEHVKTLPAVKLLLSSPTPVEELLTSGSSSLH